MAIPLSWGITISDTPSARVAHSLFLSLSYINIEHLSAPTMLFAYFDIKGKLSGKDILYNILVPNAISSARISSSVMVILFCCASL